MTKKMKIILAVLLVDAIILLGITAFFLLRESPESLSAQANRAAAEKRYDAALRSCSLAAELSQKRDGQSSAAYAEILLQKGKILYDMSLFTAAADCGKAAIEIFRNRQNYSGLALAQINTADALSASGNFLSAADLYADALLINVERPVLPVETLLAARLALALCLINENKNEDAGRLLRECLPQAEKLYAANPARLAMLHYYLGNAGLGAGNLNQAENCYQKSVALLQKTPKESSYGIALNHWGMAKIMYMRKKYAPARTEAQTALAGLPKESIEAELIRKTVAKWTEK